jgi:hypothetical protein
VKHKISELLMLDITNILFLITVVSGFGNIIFTHACFIILYVVFGILIVLNELNHFKVLSVLYVFFVFLAMLMVGIRSIMGFTIGLSLILNFTIGAGLAHAVVRGSIEKKTARLIFYLVAGYFIYHMFTGSLPSEILSASRNAISIYVLSSLMLLIFLYRQDRIAAPLFPAFLYLILTIWASGRAGIISSLVIFLALGFLPERPLKLRRSRLRKIVIRGVIAVLAIVAVFIYWDELMIGVRVYMPHFKAGGLSAGFRANFISSYLQELSLFGFFFGVELKDIGIIHLFNNNPHNSYIGLHASLGIVALILFALIAFHLIKEFVDGNVIYGICILAYLFRIGTDTVIGNSFFSFIFLALIFYGVDDIWKPRIKATNQTGQ